MNRLLKLTVTIALVLLFVLSAPAQTKETAAAPVQTKEAAARLAADAEFKQLIDSYYAAWSTEDGKVNFNNPAQFYAKDANLIFYDAAPPVNGYNGWDELKAGLQKALYDGSLSSLKLTPYEDLRVTRKGDIAWTTVTFHISAKPKVGEAMEVDGRQTTIWEQRDGKWLIFHEHPSVPLPE